MQNNHKTKYLWEFYQEILLKWCCVTRSRGTVSTLQSNDLVMVLELLHLGNYCDEVNKQEGPCLIMDLILSLGNVTIFQFCFCLRWLSSLLVGEIRHRRKWRLTGRRLQTHNAFTFTLKLRRNRQGKKANEGENVVLRFIKLKLRGALVASPLRAVWPFSAGVVSDEHWTVQ